jgi:D-glycero-alpha-D-manno-heptose-7-phosphate kinase
LLISRTPLRVSFLGGGTDFPWFFEDYSGAVISAAINQHIYISAIDSFDGTTTYLKYSKLETVKQISDIQHPMFRAVLGDANIPPQDISVMAEIPSGNGLASSSAFAVGLINITATREGSKLAPQVLAKLASKLEIDILSQSIGVQDPLGSCYPGMNLHTFKPGRDVGSVNLVGEESEFPFDLVLIKVGSPTRLASNFTDLQRKYVAGNNSALSSLLELRDLTFQAGDAVAKNIESLPEFVREGWRLKMASNPNAISEEILEIGKSAENWGALAWKLVGAGGGGFILALCEKGGATKLAGELSMTGLRVICLELDYEGAKIMEV